MSWGNKLLITFLVFGTGMIYLVYRSMHTEFELVEKEYYKTELSYQQVIDASKHSQDLGSRATIASNTAGLHLQLPPEMKGKPLTGTVWFYCAYNSSRDRKVLLQPGDEAAQHFPDTLLLPGHYTAKISWEDGTNHYYSELPLTVK